MTVTRCRDDETCIRPEAEALLCCISAHSSAVTTARAKSLLQQTLNWDYLLQMALRHGVMPLLYRRISATFPESVPVEFMERLRDYFYLNAARNHLLAEELCEILQLFERHSIRAVPYKGPALAANVYGDISLRQFSDLDVLIRSRDVARASEILSQRGYRREHALTRAQEAVFLKIECEHLFARAEGQVYLDLHWEFVPKYFSLKLDAESFWERLERSSFGNTQALSFTSEDLLLILCVHAGKEFWERLVWLCDIAELIRVHPNLDWKLAMQRATEAGARRIFYISLSLARNLLGATLPEEIAAKIEADSAVRTLSLKVRRRLFRDCFEPRSISHYLRPASALERPLDRAKFYLRLAATPSPEDWSAIKLPERFLFLYYLARPFRLAKKYLPHRKPIHY